ncbi:uncharacterized protein LOC135380865 [Ornithodoros turicata]|uniref:uncharacterized protein LOC135380865 n=1 Tax=Ornithodoros turicata TaxID=34597 RepID=UPI0031399287
MTGGYKLRDRGDAGNREDEGDDTLAVAPQRDGSESNSEMSVSIAEYRRLELRVRLAEIELETQRLRSASNSGTPTEAGTYVMGEEDRMLKFASLLKGVLSPMPTQESLIPGWFEDVEATLDSYKVPSAWRAGLILPLLSEKARALLVRLNSADRADYKVLKTKILEGLRLSTAEYKRLFVNSKPDKRETWEQFAVRLENYLRYYLNSCKVTTFEDLIQLMITDRMKECLSPDAKAYVALNEKEKFLQPNELARLAENFRESVRCKAAAAAVTGTESTVERNFPKGQAKTRVIENGGAKPKRRGSYNCSSLDHIAKHCTKKAGYSAARINAVSLVSEESSSESESENVVIVARVLLPLEESSTQEMPRDVRVKLQDMHEVSVKNGEATFQAYVDSGAEITVIRKTVLANYVKTGSTMKLVSAFGDEVVAELAYVPLKLTDSSPYVSEQPSDPVFLCALVDRMAKRVNALITPDVYKGLSDASAKVMVDEGDAPEEAQNAQEHADNEDHCESTTVLGVGHDKGCDPAAGDNNSPRQIFMNSQSEDGSLREAWEQARAGKHGMIVVDGLLSHSDYVNGRECRQLVLPKERRSEVLRLAHDSDWAGHLGERKTLQRIKSSFYWPGITTDVKRYCQSCHQCQIKAPTRMTDRVPIAPIARARTPFQVINMDCIGPVNPPSARGHRYALCVVDLCTRWTEVVCLRALTAKATCEALLDIFSRLGVPETICSDQGTNFTSHLTREFLARMGATPRFSTPDHPQSNGLVERWNGTFKSMLYHTVEKHGRNWDKHVPFLLWAYREVPNATTGETPFEMMYGRVPTGPLTILQKMWSGEWTVPDGLSTSAVEYLSDLRKRLCEAGERARETGSANQENYCNRYNLRSREKQFQEDDQVLILERDGTRKLMSRWIGPVTVIRRLRPYTYQVRLSDKNFRTVHANKLRPYHARVSSVGVIFEDDVDFGQVEMIPTKKRERNFINSVEADHLSPGQRGQLLSLIKTMPQVFRDTPGECKVGKHVIRIKPGEAPQRVYPYKIPMAYRKEVERQISELLEWGLIYPTESKFAHPIVCVSKKDGGMRLCVDYRKLNAITEPDAFPMSQSTEILYQVARARYITVIDMLRGYWQIRLDEESQQCTSFITHHGQYAWKVMPYGLRNSASTFQRTINEIMAPHSEYACAYIDDVAIYSATWEDHLEHLARVLGSVAAAGLTVNLKKCKFAQNRVHYLGHIVGSGTHAPDPERIKAVENIARPETKSQLRSFLGICNYYRDYVPRYSEIVLPLTNMTNRRTPQRLPWSEEATRSFQEIKEALANAPSLFAPDPSRDYILATDASGSAVGACLAQEHENGRECPVAFLSRKLTPAQTRWATIEREAFAIIWSLQRLETWLFGATIKVVTDHNPLKYLTLTTPHSARLTRWALALQRFNITIVHKKGSLNCNADALSRLTTADEHSLVS